MTTTSSLAISRWLALLGMTLSLCLARSIVGDDAKELPPISQPNKAAGSGPSSGSSDSGSSDSGSTSSGSNSTGSAGIAATSGRTLDADQKQLAERFSKLEEILMRVSELEAASNPARASLLQQAAQLSKQLATLQRLESAADLLKKGQLSLALKEQESTQDSMKKLLELLQSENRQSRIRDDRAKVEALIKDIQRIERLQRSLRGRTESGQDSKDVDRDQKDIRQQAGDTEKALREQDPNAKEDDDSDDDSDKESDSNDKSNKSDKGKNGEKRQAKDAKGTDDNKEKGATEDPPDETKDGKNQERTPKDSDSPDSPPQKSKSQGKSEKDSSESEAQPTADDSSPGEQSDQQPNDPKKGAKKSLSREEVARKRLKNAQKRMREAEEELENKQRENATDKQQEAEEELRLAAEELERILRQLREEEVERTLADLESRIRRMLQMQGRVLDQTKETIASVARDDRSLEIQTSKLAIEERKIQIEGQKALLLLQDEGSSLAFPEALEQINRDSAFVVDLLSQSKLGDSCINTQMEIISSLEELLQSLTETQKKLEEKKRKNDGNGQKGGGSPPQEEQPLVDGLAELRLIKTLQLRINTRTERLSKEAGTSEDAAGDSKDDQIRKQLEDLALRQDKIKQVTRDIILEQAKR